MANIRTSLKPSKPPPAPGGCPTCAANDKTLTPEEQRKLDEITKDLGPQAKEAIAHSPSMQRDLIRLHDAGWKIETGPGRFEGYGSGYKGLNFENAKLIAIKDPNDTLSLAHEMQHGVNTMDGSFAVPTARGSLSEDAFASQYATARIGDERSAFDRSVTVKDEILANGGPDIGTPAVLDQPNTTRYFDNYMDEARGIYRRLP